ncbi:MAG: helicase-related protein [Nannocystaceae bacterium]
MHATPTSEPPNPGHRYAAGARVEIRDEEWMIRSVHATATGAHALRVVGISELVRGRDGLFLDDLDDVTILDPRETALVDDPSPRYRQTRLYLESLLRQSPPTTGELAIGPRGAMDPANYQLVPAAKALAQPRARILIADGVGLGKTIEVGILLSELIRRHRGRRILVVALRSVLEQFQEELWARFTIPLVRLDSRGIARVQQRIPANMNPFHHYDRVIISIDTLKKDEKYRRYLSDCRWDAIVIDECQHVAERSTRGGQASMRAVLARLLAGTCDSLIMTSATPHDGRPESFASLMNLLDPTAVANPSSFTNEEIGGLYVRRFKKDIEHEVRASFQDRRLIPHHVAATGPENLVYESLAEIELRTLGRKAADGGFVGSGALFRTLLLKSALSSADALMSTIDERLKNPRLKAATTEADHDREQLKELRDLVEAAAGNAEHLPSKVDAVIELLRELNVADPERDERVVIFSERVHTLAMLEERLTAALDLPKGAIGVFTGGLDDAKQQAMVKEFGSRESALRVLLASDAAAEGINLHFYCHRLVHFDIPWSLITLEQRNGRIDRYGQTREPEIHYLLSIPADDQLRGDLRVLERLVEKEHEAHKNLGDVRSLLRLQDAEAEEAHVMIGVAAGKSAEEIIPDLPEPDDEDDDGLDFLASLAAAQLADEAERAEVATAPVSALYTDDLNFTIEAFQELADHHPEIDPVRQHPEASGIELKAPPDLLRRFESLPPELLRETQGQLKLTTDRAFLMRELQRARERSDAWPEWHLLWELHPMSEWLCDRMVAHMSRHAAPILRVPRGVEEGRACFLVQVMIANRRSQPMISAWIGVDLALAAAKDPSTADIRCTDLSDLIPALGLDSDLANDGAALDATQLLPLRERVVAAAQAHMQQLRAARATELGAKLRAETRRLTAWADGRLDAIDDALEGEKRPAHRRRLEQRRAEIEERKQRRLNWYREALATDSEPFIRLAAVFVPATHPVTAPRSGSK